MLEYRKSRAHHARSLLAQLVSATQQHAQVNPDRRELRMMVALDAQRLLPTLKPGDLDRVVDYVLEEMARASMPRTRRRAKILRFPLERRRC